MRGVAFSNVKGRVVRTYNYKRGIVTDHRTGLSLQLKAVLDGQIDAFIQAFASKWSSEGASEWNK
jgi:protein subunit release factor A